MGSVLVTTGVPGSGKTYLRCARFLVDDFLLGHTGLFISNFPVNIKEVSNCLAERCRGMRVIRRAGCAYWSDNPDSFARRICLLSDSDISSLRSGGVSPSSLFGRFDLQDAHISIDEIHEVIRTDCSEAVSSGWSDFVGTIRHRGCVIEGITQDLSTLHDSFVSRASMRIELVSVNDLRDPYFGIPLSDWFELRAGFTGSYLDCCGYNEFSKSAAGRWKRVHSRVFTLDPDYFRFYNSFNVPSPVVKVGSFPL